MLMYLIILLILIIAFAIYIAWGQDDNFSFYVVFILLAATLYVLACPNVYRNTTEAFTEAAVEKSVGQAGIIDFDAYKKLTFLYKDATKILQPKFEYVLSGFRGNARVDDEQKFDDQGNAIEDKKPDEVPIDKGKEKEMRATNRFLRDLRNFDPGMYFRLLMAAGGKVEPSIDEEFPM